MKTSIKTFFATALAAVILSTSAFTVSANEVDPAAKSYQTVMNKFMNSYKHNDADVMKSLLSENATYKYNREAKVVNHTAKELLAFVKQNDGLTYQNCNLDYQVVSKSDAVIMAKVNVNSGKANASQQYITLENNGKGDWKITQIYQAYASSLTNNVLARN